MTDVPGVLRDKNDISTKIQALDIRGCRTLIADGIIAGGMIPKVGSRQGSRHGCSPRQITACAGVKLFRMGALVGPACDLRARVRVCHPCADRVLHPMPIARREGLAHH
jgi:hypothetical protein